VVRFRRFLCRAFGHAGPVPVTGRIGNRKAIASICPRCRGVIAVRAASRHERRRVIFGRPA
jgi:hypothetical protein